MEHGFSRPVHWLTDVQSGTGRAVSIVPAGQWYRGVLYRAAMPVFTLPRYHGAYDPSDPVGAVANHP